MEPVVSATRGSVSPARLAANRLNALRSTGPRTEQGKASSSGNATRHGLLSRQPVLADEDPADLEALARQLIDHFNPAVGTEQLLVEDIIALVWRLRRLARVENALFVIGVGAPALRALADAGEASSAIGLAFASQAPTFAILTRYETSLVHRLRRSLADLERLQSDRATSLSGLSIVPRRP